MISRYKQKKRASLLVIEIYKVLKFTNAICILFIIERLRSLGGTQPPYHEPVGIDNPIMQFGSKFFGQCLPVTSTINSCTDVPQQLR